MSTNRVPFCDPEGPRRAGPFLPQADPRKESRLVRASQIIAPLGGWGCGIQAPAKDTPVAPMTEGNRYSRSLYLYKSKKNVMFITSK